MNHYADDSAAAHQQELEHRRWEEEWNSDQEFQRWLELLNGWRSTTKHYETTEEKPL